MVLEVFKKSCPRYHLFAVLMQALVGTLARCGNNFAQILHKLYSTLLRMRYLSASLRKGLSLCYITIQRVQESVAQMDRASPIRAARTLSLAAHLPA